jgi:phosphoribosylformylglycinamidine synthase
VPRSIPKQAPKLSLSEYITALVCKSELTSPFVTAGVCPTEASTEYEDAECCCNALPTIVSVDAIYIHLVHSINKDAEAELLRPGSPSRQTFDHLLSYGDVIALPGTRSAFEEGSRIIYVFPMLGSVSPWSSKATDISALCNLTNHINRLEHGVAFAVRIDDGVLLRQDLDLFSPHIHDRMNQTASLTPPTQNTIFLESQPAPLCAVNITPTDMSPREKLKHANKELGLTLASDEINYLVDAFILGTDLIARNPTDAGLFMFVQVNLEHCRPKISGRLTGCHNQPPSSQ